MWVQEEKPERLHLREWPLVFVVLLGAVLVFDGIPRALSGIKVGGSAVDIVMGAGWFLIPFFALVFTQVVDVIFDRPSGQVTVIRAGLFGRRVKAYPIDDLRDVDVDRRGGGDTLTFRLRLVLPKGSVPISGHPAGIPDWNGTSAQTARRWLGLTG